MKNISFVAALFLWSTFLQAQEFDKAKMDSLFTIIEENEKGMGSISIFKDGKEVYQRSIGYADREMEIPATAKTKYRIGSITKLYTSTIFMQLAQEKKVDLKTTIDKYYPQIPNADEITIEHLLRHRSGLFNFTNEEAYLEYMGQPRTQQQMLDHFTSHEPVFEPGEKAEYSNTNYVLLSYIAEKIEKKKFAEILQSRIVKPCNLQDTYIGGKTSTAMNEALSYTKIGDWELSSQTDMSIPTGAGAIVSTATDVNRFLHCLFTEKLITKSSLAQMTALMDDYGMGIFEYPFDEKKWFGHTGGIDAFQSMAAYLPGENISIAYLSNGASMAINDVVLGALDIYFGNEYALPDFTTIEVTPEMLQQYVGTYSSPGFPLKITITTDKNTLVAQATGQPSFPLEAYEKHKFRFDPARLTLEFLPDENKMILRQGGGVYELTKE